MAPSSSQDRIATGTSSTTSRSPARTSSGLTESCFRRGHGSAILRSLRERVCSHTSRTQTESGSSYAAQLPANEFVPRPLGLGRGVRERDSGIDRFVTIAFREDHDRVQINLLNRLEVRYELGESEECVWHCLHISRPLAPDAFQEGTRPDRFDHSD